jgi:proline- and glutamine-rich splicing factor
LNSFSFKSAGRCRLFCGNLPADLNENEFKDLFKKFGETGECFLNTQRSFGFIKLDTRINAEHAKQELDGTVFKGRTIRVRFATHGAAVKVKNLSPYISNEYLEQAFSMFGPVERAVVIVDDKGRPTGEGIVEFERKPASVQCINKCQENCFILTSYPKPIVVEPLEQKDEEDGLPEKSIIKNSQFYMEREVQAHFASHNSNEHKLAVKWRELYELEKQINEEGKRRIEQAKEMLEFEIEQALIENKTMQLKEDLRMKQEELQRIEDMRKGEFARRQDIEMRRIDEERQRQEQMMMMQKQGGNMPNQRGGNNNNPMQGQFDQQNQMNQPNQALGAMQGNNNNNQRRGNNMNNQQNNFNTQSNTKFPGDMNNQDLNSLPPAQQQALIGAQLSCAMAAAAQQGNMNMGNGMFDQNDQMQQQQQQNNNNFNNGNNNHGNGGHKHHRDDHRGGNSSSGGNNRRQFDRRGGNNRGGNRDDSYPGYDTKRARF